MINSTYSSYTTLVNNAESALSFPINIIDENTTPNRAVTSQQFVSKF